MSNVDGSASQQWPRAVADDDPRGVVRPDGTDQTDRTHQTNGANQNVNPSTDRFASDAIRPIPPTPGVVPTASRQNGEYPAPQYYSQQPGPPPTRMPPPPLPPWQTIPAPGAPQQPMPPQSLPPRSPGQPQSQQTRPAQQPPQQPQAHQRPPAPATGSVPQQPQHWPVPPHQPQPPIPHQWMPQQAQPAPGPGQPGAAPQWNQQYVPQRYGPQQPDPPRQPDPQYTANPYPPAHYAPTLYPPAQYPPTHYLPAQHEQAQQLAPPAGLQPDRLVKEKGPMQARPGWRDALRAASGGLINLGESKSQQQVNEMMARVRQPIKGDFRIAVLSLKGGVGKTTTSVGLGSVFASLRGDRVIAVDANPDLGTLAGRVPQQTRSTVRTLLNDPDINRYTDVRQHTSQASSNLEVLASERDPAVSEAFSEADYRRVLEILENYYNIIITDCGTGLMHSAMSGVLSMANAIVLVTSPAVDGAQSASATLDWLNAHGYGHLVHEAVVVISASKSGNSPIDLDMLTDHFLGRTRAVQIIPYDDHLAVGSHLELEQLNRRTRIAFLELAATVADSFPAPDPLPGPPMPW